MVLPGFDWWASVELGAKTRRPALGNPVLADREYWIRRSFNPPCDAIRRNMLIICRIKQMTKHEMSQSDVRISLKVACYVNFNPAECPYKVAPKQSF